MNEARLKAYIHIARPDHWIKQLFILPGAVLATILTQACSYAVLIRVFLALASTCFVASSNYVINEWLDRRYDRYHPVKKKRPAVTEALDARVIVLEYLSLCGIGVAIGFMANRFVCAALAALWIMGLVYNVSPIRTKDIAYLDVVSESANNALRFLIGWFAVQELTFPPSSAVLGYWAAGAYLMALKRYSEFRAIGNHELAAMYRKSFGTYSELSLLDSSLFYALISVFMIGVFLLKYHIEYILLMPFLCGLYVKYFNIALEEDSAAQRPEKLIREGGLMRQVALFLMAFAILTFVRLPFLDSLMSPMLLGVLR